MNIKKLVSIIFIIVIFTAGALNAKTITKSIDVVFNSINITVDGINVEAENILYNGTTYVPLRNVAEMLGKEVSWNESTRTADIKEPSNPGWYLVESIFIQPENMTYTNNFLATNEKGETVMEVKQDSEGDLVLSQDYHYIPSGKQIDYKECEYKWTKPQEFIREGESFSITGNIIPVKGENFYISGQIHSFNKLNKTGEWNSSYWIKTSTPETIMSYPFGKSSLGDRQTVTVTFGGLGYSFNWEYVYEWRE